MEKLIIKGYNDDELEYEYAEGDDRPCECCGEYLDDDEFRENDGVCWACLEDKEEDQ